MITGGAGFIGSTLVRALVNAGDDEVCNVDKLTYAGNIANLAEIDGKPNHRLVVADIADRDSMRATFAEFRPEAIINLAAESHVDRSIDDPGIFIHTNVVGTGVLLQEGLAHWLALSSVERPKFRFLQVSTDEVYGELGADGYFTELSPYQPNSPYAASKAGADHLARAYYRTYGLPVIVTNSSNNYGPFQFPEKLIPLVILNAIEGREIPVYGQGENVRDWIYVDDHAAALRRVLATGEPGATYLIGARAEMRNIDLVRKICQILDEAGSQSPYRPHQELISFGPDRPGHDARYAIDPGRIENEIGWRAKETLGSGLEKTVAWYLENRDWCNQTRAQYDRTRLGLGKTQQEDTA